MALLGFTVYAQSATITGLPLSTVEAPAGTVLSLVFNASYEGSYQSIVIIELKLPDGFQLLDTSITMNGEVQEGYTITEGSEGWITILDQQLEPPNGNLTITITLAVPQEPGEYNVSWRLVAGATTRLSPLPPDDTVGYTLAEVQAPPETTTTTGPPAATTTSGATETATTSAATKTSTTPPSTTPRSSPTHTLTGATNTPTAGVARATHPAKPGRSYTLLAAIIVAVALAGVLLLLRR
jgi:hypothetical protein